MTTYYCPRCGCTEYDTNYRCVNGCGVVVARSDRLSTEGLSSALYHISKMCGNSRTQTRRIQAIQYRAESALRGEYKEMPKDTPRPDKTNYALEKELRFVKKERDALAAQVTLLRDSGQELADLMDDTHQGDYVPDSFTTQPMRLALHESSGEVASARRDARVKAEALEELADSLTLSFDRNIIGKNGILEKASEYRQQAEGGGDDIR